MWLAYLKEIGDLMYKKNGWFQKFCWDSISQSNKNIMDMKARSLSRGKKPNQTHYF